MNISYQPTSGSTRGFTTMDPERQGVMAGRGALAMRMFSEGSGTSRVAPQQHQSGASQRSSFTTRVPTGRR